VDCVCVCENKDSQNDANFNHRNRRGIIRVHQSSLYYLLIYEIVLLRMQVCIDNKPRVLGLFQYQPTRVSFPRVQHARRLPGSRTKISSVNDPDIVTVGEALYGA